MPPTSLKHEMLSDAPTSVLQEDDIQPEFMGRLDSARGQVYAVQPLVKCMDDDDGNGYIWHTTGSSKTLTSFKSSTLLKENDHIHKCVFVVDRKGLDRPGLVHCTQPACDVRVECGGQIGLQPSIL